LCSKLGLLHRPLSAAKRWQRPLALLFGPVMGWSGVAHLEERHCLPARESLLDVSALALTPNHLLFVQVDTGAQSFVTNVV
jgi:hypothetical protein